MASFRLIAEKDAPKNQKPTAVSRRMAEYETYLGQVPSGKVGQITPDDGDTPRGVAMRLTRAGKRLAKNVTVWTADGQVYFKAG